MFYDNRLHAESRLEKEEKKERGKSQNSVAELFKMQKKKCLCSVVSPPAPFPGTQTSRVDTNPTKEGLFSMQRESASKSEQQLITLHPKTAN